MFDEETFAWTNKELPSQPLWENAGKNLGPPTPIQLKTWPVSLSGKNVVGIAPTNSGKTLAFLLPAIILAKDSVGVILSPTRELALQTFKISSRLAPSSLCSGGREDLNTSGGIVVGTPGRVRERDLKKCTVLVLDEADKVLEQDPPLLKETKQILLFSATRIEWRHDDAVEISVAPRCSTMQSVHVCARHKRVRILGKFLEKIEKSRHLKILIFCKTAKIVLELFSSPPLLKWKRRCVHGKMPQSKRDSNLFDFRAGKANVLISTDLAARGLHVPNVNYVVNYDFPSNLDTYIHRLGRIRDEKGQSISFFTRNLKKLAPDLSELLISNGQRVEPRLAELAREESCVVLQALRQVAKEV